MNNEWKEKGGEGVRTTAVTATAPAVAAQARGSLARARTRKGSRHPPPHPAHPDAPGLWGGASPPPRPCPRLAPRPARGIPPRGCRSRFCRHGCRGCRDSRIPGGRLARRRRCGGRPHWARTTPLRPRPVKRCAHHRPPPRAVPPLLALEDAAADVQLPLSPAVTARRHLHISAFVAATVVGVTAVARVAPIARVGGAAAP